MKKYPKALRTLGDHIRKRRLDLRLEQQDLARHFGRSVSTIQNWEHNETKPGSDVRAAVDAFLGYDPGTKW